MSQVAGGLSGNTYADLMWYKTAISLVFELPALVLSAIRTRAAMLTGMKFQPHSERHMSITQNFTHIEVTPKGLGMAKVSFLACPFAYLGPLIRVSGPEVRACCSDLALIFVFSQTDTEISRLQSLLNQGLTCVRFSSL